MRSEYNETRDAVLHGPRAERPNTRFWENRGASCQTERQMQYSILVIGEPLVAVLKAVV